MVVVHRALGFRFVIYTADHGPAHVHAIGSGLTTIDLIGAKQPKLVFSVGIKRSDLRRLMAEVTERRAALLEAWERIHGAGD